MKNIAIICLLLALATGCRTQPPDAACAARATTNDADIIEHYVTSVTVIFSEGQTVPPIPASVSNALINLQAETNSLLQPLLLEYGLRLHLQFLEKSGMARKLPVKSDALLKALVSSLRLQPYRTAHEAGWLDRQFDYHFIASGRDYSSYQVYLWILERNEATLEWPNPTRIRQLMESIRKTGSQGVGGRGNCHYGCI